MAKAMVDSTGNPAILPGIFPDGMAPVVFTRPNDGQRELMMMQWGLPSGLCEPQFPEALGCQVRVLRESYNGLKANSYFLPFDPDEARSVSNSIANIDEMKTTGQLNVMRHDEAGAAGC